ncbi:hypothetical protein SK128_006553, partial [Halocaridina rubra]
SDHVYESIGDLLVPNPSPVYMAVSPNQRSPRRMSSSTLQQTSSKKWRSHGGKSSGDIPYELGRLTSERPMIRRASSASVNLYEPGSPLPRNSLYGTISRSARKEVYKPEMKYASS